MPSLSRRRESDIRADRLESEVRASEFLDPSFKNKRKFMCGGPGGCGHVFEERSRTCPRCEKRTMGELKPMTVSERERRDSLARARAGRGARLPGQGA